MFSSHPTAVLWFRAILLVAGGLLWDGVVTEAQARCGGLPLSRSHQAWSEGRFVGSQLPAAPLPRCQGPSCSDPPPPAAPIVVENQRGAEGLLVAATALSRPDVREAVRSEERNVMSPLLSGGVFRPPRV